METLLYILIPLLLLRKKTPAPQQGPPISPNDGVPSQMRPGGGGGSQYQGAPSGGSPSSGAKSDDPSTRGGYKYRGMV